MNERIRAALASMYGNWPRAVSAAFPPSPHNDGAGDTCLCGVCLEAVAFGGALCGNGHALHAACAADHALGGGNCPTCRAQSFHPLVGALGDTTFEDVAEADAGGGVSWVGGCGWGKSITWWGGGWWFEYRWRRL